MTAAAGAIVPRFGRTAFPYVALGLLVSVSAFLGPFTMTFSPAAVKAVQGRKVLFPDQFEEEQEVYRFTLPGAEMERYECLAGPHPCLPKIVPPLGQLGALVLDVNDPLPPGYAALGDSRPLLSSLGEPDLKIVRGATSCSSGGLVLVRAEAKVALPPGAP